MVVRTKGLPAILFLGPLRLFCVLPDLSPGVYSRLLAQPRCSLS